MQAVATRIEFSEDLFHEAHEIMKDIEKELLGPEMRRAEHSEVEQLLQARSSELMRALLQSYLDARAQEEQEVEVRGADGVSRSHVRDGARKLETLFGEVTVNRRLYQSPGVDGLAPMDAALNLPAERYSHEVRRLVAVESAQSSFDEVVERISRLTGAHVPKRQVEELAERAAQDYDEFYAQRVVEPEDTSDPLIMSFDGKGVAMRLEDLRPATRAAAEATPRRLHTRLAPGEKRNRKRMATVATIYTLAPWPRTVADVLHTLRSEDVEDKRPQPVGKRVWASLSHSSQQVIDDAFAEALRRDPTRHRRWIVLVDGQQDQIRRVQRAAREAKVKVTIVLDIVHVLEYLWKAAYVFHSQGSVEAETWVRHRLLALLQGKSGGTVAKSIRQMVARRSLSDKAAKPVHECARYLVSHTRWLHYDRALADGSPIATGAIEGACRYLIQDRMGRTGATWSLRGAEAIMRLRSLRASNDFEAYWEFHLTRERERTHLQRYADNVAPDPLPRPRPRLKLVK
jgi:hypothetical protein